MKTFFIIMILAVGAAFAFYYFDPLGYFGERTIDFGDAQQLQEQKEKVKQSVEELVEDVGERVKTDSIEYIRDLVPFGHEKMDDREVDTIVLHSVYNPLDDDRYNPDKIIAIFKTYDVSSHYLIDRDGVVHILVDEKDAASHAGYGAGNRHPDGREDINTTSVGIEIINAEDDEPTEEQYTSLRELIDQINNRHEIEYVLLHKDINDGKTDPWNFDLEKAGVETNILL